MRELTWFERGDGATTKAIANVEQVLGLRFPSDFSGFASEYAGASNPDESEFDFVDRSGRKRLANFGAVLQFAGSGPDTIVEATEDLRSQIPSGIVPVVATGTGDYICLDCRAESNMQVVYFAHERSGDEAIIPLAKSFTDFLEVLREPNDF